MLKVSGAIVLTLLFAGAVTAIGQNLMMDVATADAQQNIPSRGMTMENVEENFGAPNNKRAPIGDPPITRWEYPQFIVYFEYKRVIHSVAKRPVS